VTSTQPQVQPPHTGNNVAGASVDNKVAALWPKKQTQQQLELKPEGFRHHWPTRMPVSDKPQCAASVEMAERSTTPTLNQ